MLPEDLNAVTASYHRAMHGGELVDTFYNIFLEKSPEVAQKFRHTDFTHQKLALRQSLLLMILFNSNGESAQQELEKLGDRHSRRAADVPPHLYTLWLDALCEALNQHDPEYSPELEVAWRVTMQPGIDLLRSENRALLIDAMLTTIAYHRVGDRPGRWEPRARKRRPKWSTPLKQPRQIAKLPQNRSKWF